ncbi:uncharacterized protein [Rhodnius prolixus]|uniref:uncharacterized protein n=1 Tax=Rhodnius prolixus TaxID=13249 RepID=UPI003D18C239
MRALALETIHSRYPARDWLHIYTDGSARAATHNAGAGVYCREFTLAEPVGRMYTNFDGEVKAISMALAKLIEDKKDNPQIVLFIDSQAAILAISSRHYTDHSEVGIARSHIAVLIERGTRVVLQWVPSHCGLTGNKQADELARRGAEMQQPDTPLAFSAVKKVVKSSYNEEIKRTQQHQAEGKRWRTLLENPVSVTAARKEAVACFRMTTGHDYLQKHLHRIGVVDSPMCPLCLQEEEMDSQHLPVCHALIDVANDSTNINIHDNKAIMTKLYWAARSRMD